MKAPTVPIVVIVVIVAGVLAYFYYGGDLEIPSAGKTTVAGLQIAESALRLVESDLKNPSGGYEDYVKYEPGNVIRSSEENTPENMGVGTYTDRDLYLIYSTLADATGDQGYAAIASVKFDDFYSECKDDNLCDGDMYGAVYNEWRRTENEEYKNALDSAKSALIAKAGENASLTTFSFGESLENSLSADNCAVGIIVLEIRNAGIQEDNLTGLESFAAAIQEEGVLESAETLSTLSSCGNFMVGLYDATQKSTYKNSAEKILQLIWEKHPNLKEFGEGAANNLHVTEDVLATALLAAGLHDTKIEVTRN